MRSDLGVAVTIILLLHVCLLVGCVNLCNYRLPVGHMIHVFIPFGAGHAIRRGT